MNNYARAGLFLAIGLVLAAAVIGFNYRVAKKHSDMINQTIRVKGYAVKNINSDYATWTGNFNVRAATLKAAYDQLAQNRKVVQEFLINENIPASAINFSQIRVNTNYRMNNSGYSTNEVLDYSLYQDISLESDDLQLITGVAKNISTLIEQGINISSYSPQYLYTKIEDLKIEMLAAAASNAKERAENLARSTGSKVGPLTYASQGVFQITAPHSYEVSDYGRFDTQTIEKAIKAVVTMEFAIE
jgi:hypothetical protein